MSPKVNSVDQLDDLPSGLHASLMQQMVIVQSEMQRFYESELQRREAIVQVLMQREN